MKKLPVIFIVIVFLGAFTFAPSHSLSQDAKTSAPKTANPSVAEHQQKPGQEVSGMYSFLKDGEFVQITVEDDGKVTGYLSRYGEADSEKQAFIEQYFRGGKLDGDKLAFTTEAVQAEWFDFKGSVERGEGKNPADEAYYILKGTLTENTSDGAKKVSADSQEVVFKRFPK
jgi:hypothetical protein